MSSFLYSEAIYLRLFAFTIPFVISVKDVEQKYAFPIRCVVEGGVFLLSC